MGEKRSLPELIATYSLTRREGEILGLILQDCNNEEILAKLVISRNTLLKHLQNLYRKCGVSSRWTCGSCRDNGTQQEGGCEETLGFLAAAP